MTNPADVDAPIPMGIPATTRSDQFTVMQRTFLAPLRGVIMRVTQDVPHCHRQVLQQLGSDHLIGITGDGELSGQRHPDAADHDRQMELPAVPPAEIALLYPASVG